MAQTKSGAKKQSDTIKKKYGENYWKEIGKKGGQRRVKTKGFGTHRDKAKYYGKNNLKSKKEA